MILAVLVLKNCVKTAEFFKDVIKVRSAEIEQLRTALNQMKREFAVQDRENYLARQRAADAEKKLSDQLYLGEDNIFFYALLLTRL